MYFRLCRCRLWAQLLLPCSHLRSHCLSLASPFFLLHTSHLVPSTEGTILKYAFVETKALLAILKHKEEAIVVQHIAHLSHLLTMKSFQTLQSGHFLCTPSNLMAPTALCSWCYHGSHVGCLFVLLCLSCEQKLGTQTIGISVVFIWSPLPRAQRVLSKCSPKDSSDKY